MTSLSSTSPRSIGLFGRWRHWVRRRRFALQALALCVAFAVLAWMCLAIEFVYAGDQADAQAAALTFGIMHPPGYSLFVAGGWTFWQAAGRWLFAPEPAQAITLFNILAAAALTYLMMILCARVTGRRAWSLIGPLLLWTIPHNAQLIIMPEVYPFYAALLAGALLAAEGLRRRPELWRLILAGALWGAFCTGRLYNLPFTLAFLLFIGTIPREQWPMPRGGRVAVFLAAMALPYLVCVGHLRSQIGQPGLVNYMWSLREDVAKPDSIPWRWTSEETYHTWWMMTGQQYRSLLDVSVRGLLRGLEGYRQTLAGGALGVAALAGLGVLAARGAARLRRRRNRLGLLVAAGAVWEAGFFQFFQPGDFGTMLMPLEMYVMLLAGAGLADVARRRNRRRRWRGSGAALAGVAAALALIIWNADPSAEHQFSRVCHARAFAAMNPSGAAVIDASLPADWHFIPFDAVIVTDWFWYGTLVYGAIKFERPDVRVIHGLSVETSHELLGRQDRERPLFFFATYQIEEIADCLSCRFHFRPEGMMYFIEGE